MPGLSLMGGAQVGVASASAGGGYSSAVAPSTATEAAFGTAPTNVSGPGVLAPTHPAGLAFWWSVASVGALLFLYFTLPA